MPAGAAAALTAALQMGWEILIHEFDLPQNLLSNPIFNGYDYNVLIGVEHCKP